MIVYVDGVTFHEEASITVRTSSPQRLTQMHSHYYHRRPLPKPGTPLRICHRCEQQEWRARQYGMLRPRTYTCRLCGHRTCSHLADDKNDNDHSCVCAECRLNSSRATQ
jgi:hypothetical protein